LSNSSIPVRSSAWREKKGERKGEEGVLRGKEKRRGGGGNRGSVRTFVPIPLILSEKRRKDVPQEKEKKKREGERGKRGA